MHRRLQTEEPQQYTNLKRGIIVVKFKHSLFPEQEMKSGKKYPNIWCALSLVFKVPFQSRNFDMFYAFLYQFI